MAPVIVGAGKLEIWRAGGRLEAQAVADAVVLRQNLFSTWKHEFLFPRLSTVDDWMRPTNIIEDIQFSPLKVHW